ncbi:SDR family NAD(P)-dependent oxidoreductase [Paraburkholderia hospita]|uniref:SDR family NAD(P)-dependent oxidoreductase n=1 Tax=Paraburkholderia hospita TaxID=169430 RepID=UPI000B349EF4|nr:SDR family NAD(P)-dependent oxidoreductase [Paraburkholderia hospita]OUL68250.1 hypothetical protein CA603_52060 [Paraburkholderia hospita]
MNQPVVLITGALTGIGRATAFAFARAGARLVVSGRRAAEGAALEAELREAGAEALFVKADVRHDEEVRNLVDQTLLVGHRFSGQRRIPEYSDRAPTSGCGYPLRNRRPIADRLHMFEHRRVWSRPMFRAAVLQLRWASDTVKIPTNDWVKRRHAGHHQLNIPKRAHRESSLCSYIVSVAKMVEEPFLILETRRID